MPLPPTSSTRIDNHVRATINYLHAQQMASHNPY
ncbi:hypothetical protein F4554_005113 [Actinopolymorpha rutila]|uniref:Uncharacterized protein n=1 Tax=Actinopolymorpha rutila TaxID=446787 RepID=A0A852ZK17_9ACTN|nr:hypothetical protein [Actinopolymorpha rutila]